MPNNKWVIEGRIECQGAGRSIAEEPFDSEGAARQHYSEVTAWWIEAGCKVANPVLLHPDGRREVLK